MSMRIRFSVYDLAAIAIIIMGAFGGYGAYMQLSHIENRDLASALNKDITIIRNSLITETNKFNDSFAGLSSVLLHQGLGANEKEIVWSSMSAQRSAGNDRALTSLNEIHFIATTGERGSDAACVIKKATSESPKANEDLCAHQPTRALLFGVDSISGMRFTNLRGTYLAQLFAPATSAHQPALIYPVLDDNALLKGWIIASISFKPLESFMQESRMQGLHLRVFDVEDETIIPYAIHRDSIAKTPIISHQATSKDSATHHNISIIANYPGDITYIRDGRHVRESSFLLSGRRALIYVSRDFGYGTYPSLIGAAIAAICLIIALLFLMQSRTRARAETIAQRITKQLRANEDRLRAAAEGSNDGIWDWDVRENIVWFSPRYYSMLGYAPNEFTASFDAFLTRLHPDDADFVQKHVTEHFENGRAYDLTFRMLHKNGEYRWIRSRGQARFEGGVAVRMAGVHTDITEQKSRELELAEARKQAESAAYVKANFLANMSHEIRTPLNGIIGITELMYNTKLDSKQTQYLSTLHASSGALMQIVNDILDYSKLDAGKMQVESIAFSLPELAQEAIAMVAPNAQKKDALQIIYRYDPTLKTCFIGDPTRIRQILLNLLSNAIKFTSEGYVYINIQTAKAAANGEQEIELVVSDTGIGMNDAQLRDAFSQFTQADNSTTRKYGGTGLGLSIVNELARLLGGNVHIESVVGKGTRFVVKLPLKMQEMQKTPHETYPHLAQKRLLCVDNISISADVMAEIIAHHGGHSEVLYQPEKTIETLEKAHARGKPFHALVIERHMGKARATAIAKKIKAHADLASTHLLMLTSKSTPGDGKKMRDIGFEGYLSKPVTAEHLLFALNAMLGEKTMDANDLFLTRHSYNEAHSIEQTQKETRPPKAQTGTEKHVLVVEDNETNQHVIEWLLDDLNIAHKIAKNGEAAIAALDAAAGTYHLIFMDCHMPIMDGFEATRHIRNRSDDYQQIPIIALTANTQPEDRLRCVQSGMNDFLAKPINKASLQAVLNNWLDDNGKQSADQQKSPEKDIKEAVQALDSSRLKEITKGSKSRTKRFIEIFTETSNEALAGLDAAMQSNDAKQLKFHAHTLKGAAGNVGALAMHAMCLQLEEVAQTQDLQSAESYITGLREAAKDFEDASAALLNRLDDD